MIRRLALFGLLVGLFFRIGAASGQESAPAFKEGDYWKFEYKKSGGAYVSTNLPPGTYTIVFQNGKLLIEGSDTAKAGLDMFGLAVPGLTSQPWYKFPLEVGKTWDLQQKLGGSGKSFVRHIDFTVEKADKITVSSGSFDVIKLTRTTRQTIASNTSRGETVYYYSPTTKSTVKASFSGPSGEVGEVNLIEYGSKP